MGQKTHPRGFRLGVIKPWKSRWYAERNFGEMLREDETIGEPVGAEIHDDGKGKGDDQALLTA